MKKKLIDWNFLWIILGCVFLLFMGGKWNVPAATWIGSIFFLRYFRKQENGWGILLAVPFILGASHVFFLGLAVQVTLQFQILIAVSYTLYILIPCLIDRALYPRIKSPLLSTLMYPAALIMVQFLLSYIEQLGTVLHWTGSLFAMKPLIQLVSLTGVWGPSFLVGWLASIVNTLWEERLSFARTKVPVLAFTAVFALVTVWGGARMVFFPPEPGTVKVGSVVAGLPEDNISYRYIDDMTPAEQAAHRDEYRRWTRAVQDKLFAVSEELVSSGIKILSWPSGNAAVFSEDLDGLVERMQAFAEAHQIYFFPSLLVMDAADVPDPNRVLAITPEGDIAYTHYKGRNPNQGYYQGNEIQTIDTPYGRIASPICFEMEFHRYIRQVGKAGVDILIVPGDEPSRQNAVVHTELSMFRAVENGCSMLRTTLEGLTMGADYEGRVLSQMNYYQTLDSRTIVTELPTHGVRTLYSRWGDWFAYGCILLLVLLLGVGIRDTLAERLTGRG